MVICCVPKCKNKSQTHRMTNGSQPARMFTFPKNKTRRDIWIKAVNRMNWEPTESSRVCHVHFEEDMFRRRPQGLSRRWSLLSTAVPTLFEHSKPQAMSIPTQAINHWEKLRANIQKAFLLDHAYVDPRDEPTFPPSFEPSEVLLLDELSIQFQTDVLETESYNRRRCSNCESLSRQVKVLSERLRKMKSCMARATSLHYAANKKLKAKDKAMSFLNKDQLRLLMCKGRKNVCLWEETTIRRAQKLRDVCGIQGYEALLDLGYPLPSIRTLQRRFESDGIKPVKRNISHD